MDIEGAFTEASAATIVSSGTCGAQGDNLTWILDDEGTLTISGSGEMCDYTWASPSPWGSDVTEALIENSVTSIGDEAFKGCTGLTSITIPNSVTSIGGVSNPRTLVGAFEGCSRLGVNKAEGEMVSLNVSHCDNVINMFKNCTNLKSLRLFGDGANTSSSNATFNNYVKTKDTFTGCSALRTLQYDNLYLVSLTGNSKDNNYLLVDRTYEDTVVS